MGAAAFAAMGERPVDIPGMAGISLDEYGTCLAAQLGACLGVGLSVQVVHRSDAGEVLRDLADATQPRFGELTQENQTAIVGTSINASCTTPAAQGALAQTLASLSISERSAHMEKVVLRLAQEVGGAPASVLSAETPLMDAGIDSLAAMAFVSQLRTSIGVELSRALVVDYPTPREMAAHLIETVQISATSSGAPVRRESKMVTSLVQQRLTNSMLNIVMPQEPRARLLFLHGQGTSAELAQALLELRGWFDGGELPFELVIPDGTHEVAAWNKDGQFEALGLQALVDQGLYDPSKPQRMWAARFDVAVRSYLEAHPEEWRDKGLTLEEAVTLASYEQGTSEDAPQRWNDTVEYLRDIIATYGPFHGIGGFSEGAATAHNLLCMQQAGIDLGLGNVKFCLAMSPWISPMNEYEGHAKFDIPLLITSGKKDLPGFKAGFDTYSAEFAEVLQYEHDGVHEYALMTNALRQQCSDLLQKAQKSLDNSSQ
jgi:aryl carrier-like protein